MRKVIGIVSGGFDPLHAGHILYLESAKKNCDELVVGVNSDEWLVRKKGKFFMPFADRLRIIMALRCVDIVQEFDDKDGSARGIIEICRNRDPQALLLFMNGGDRTQANIPEMDVPGVAFLFGVGGATKHAASSDLLAKWVKTTHHKPPISPVG